MKERFEIPAANMELRHDCGKPITRRDYVQGVCSGCGNRIKP